MRDVLVLMPIHRPSAYLEQAVRSIIGQVDVAWRLKIAVNNCSPETFDLIVESVAQLVKLEQVDIGYYGEGSLGKIRELALRDVHEEFIALLDSDDLALENRLSVQLRYLQDNPSVAIVGSDVTLIDSGGQVLGYRKMPKFLKSGKVIFDSPLVAPSVLMRTSVYLEVGGFSEGHLCEDFDLWRRVSRHYSIHNIPKPLTQYRVHDSQSGQGSRLTQLECRVSSVLSGFDIDVDPHHDQPVISALRKLGFWNRMRLGSSYLLELPIRRLDKIRMLALLFK